MTRIRPLVSLGFVTALITSNAHALDGVSGKGTLAQYQRAFSETDNGESLQSSANLLLSLTPKLPGIFSLKGEALGSVYADSLEKDREFSARADVKELWLGLDAAGLELKVGQLLVPWGKTDGVNPTDYLTGRDYTLLSRVEEFRRIGAPGLLAAYTPNAGSSPFQITAVFNAAYAQNRLLIPRTAIPNGLVVDTDPESPDLARENFEMAAKLAYLGASWDASLSAYQGRNHFGQFVYDGNRVETVFVRQRAWGGDFSVTLEDFVLRLETAYFWMRDGGMGAGDQALTQPNHWDAALGVERPLGDRFRLLVQALYRYYPNLPNSQEYTEVNPVSTAIRRGVAKANALLVNYQDRSRLGGTLLLSYTSPEGDWESRLNLVGNFVGGDYRLSPEVSYRVFENARVFAGAEYYGGPQDRPLGALQDFRAVYLEGQYIF